MRAHLASLSAAGNVAALVVLALMAAVLSRPYDAAHAGAAPTKPPGAAPAPTPAARAVVLVVIDGLRADVAGDPAVMPFTNELARRGVSTTATVEGLVPSTIAGITTLATGAVPGPASFLRDFRSPPAERGGLFEALAGPGERSFVSGPALWAQLFGRWADAPHAAPALGGSDEAVLRAGLRALDDPAYRFGVFHFSGTDEAAHLHGARSDQYARAAGWCDDAVRQIHQRLGPEAAIVVTSDHGVTDRGGHAGPEPEVLATPLVCFGPGFTGAPLPSMRQRDVPGVIAAALGVQLPPPPAGVAHSRPRRVGFALLAAAALFFGVRLWCGILAGERARPHAFWLNLMVWVVLAFLLLGQLAVAAGLAVLALEARGTQLARGVLAYAAAPLLAVAVGGAWALLRLGAEWRYGAAPFEIPGAGVPLAVIFGLSASLPLGMLLARTPAAPEIPGTFAEAGARRRTRVALLAGMLIAVLAAPAYVLSGQTLSLSSIEVGEAYHVAVHGGGGGGAAAAVVVVILLLALPALSLVVG